MLKILAILSLIALPLSTAAAADSVERIVRTAQAVASAAVPSLAQVRLQCGTDPICAAEQIANAIGPRARIEKVRHPDTDSIRRVRSYPSVISSSYSQDGTLTIRLDRFGRKAVQEVRAVYRQIPREKRPMSIILDVRANRGGDLSRMLKFTAIFTGPVVNAIRLIGNDKTTEQNIPAVQRLQPGVPITVLVGPETASSAEIFAALMRVHAGAQIVGDKTYGKDYLYRVIPITHDVRLLVPAERVEVPGTVIAGGLIPDRARL